MGKLFGTDGIRGKVGGGVMNPEMGYRLGKAMVLFCRRKKLSPKIIIGRDTRSSGDMLLNAVVSGIRSLKGEANSAGVIPTPGLAFLAKAGDFSLGLVISASHNDASFNGFKLFTGGGGKLNDEEEAEIEELINKCGSEKDKLSDEEILPVKTEIINDALHQYEAGLISFFPASFNLNGLKVVIDCAQGATYQVAPLIFKKLGSEVIPIFIRPDGKNINENCGSQFPEKLSEEVVKNKADLGLAFDGDGDRVIAVDEKGEIMNGDQLIYIFAKMLKERGELGVDMIVSTVMSNLGLVQALKKLNISHLYTPVGDRFVYEGLVKTGAILGGEEAGHIVFRNFLPNGDGILSGLKLIEAMKFFNKPLSELGKEIIFYPKILVSVAVIRKSELSSIPEIDRVIKEAEGYFGSDGRVVVRYSGTEPLCRVMVEGRQKEEVEKYANQIADTIKSKLN